MESRLHDRDSFFYDNERPGMISRMFYQIFMGEFYNADGIQ